MLCRQDQPVSSELEGTEQGQMGPTNCDRRISHPTFVYPMARGGTAFSWGGSWPAGEASNPISPKSDQEILLQHVYGTKERRRSETSYQPKKTEQPCEVRALQDGEPSYSEVSYIEGRLDDKNRPEGCLLHGTVPVAHQFQHLLLFKVNAKSFKFQCLPFGLCTATRVFMKVLKLAIELLRTLGIRLVIYMDNMLLMACSEQIIQEHTYTARFLLENLGFIINNKKSSLSPSQHIDFLGMTVDSQAMELKLPGE